MAAPSVQPRNPLRAVLALLVVTVLWGWTFVWMKQGVLEAEVALGPRGGAAGIGLFMVLRFGIATVCLALVPSVRRGLTRKAWFGGFVIGALLLVGFLFQMFGLQGVSPAVSAFLTSLYVLFTALMTAAGKRRWPGRSLLVGALLATFGAGFIGGPPQLTFGTAEWLTIGCAFVFAAHILATDRITRGAAPMPITLACFVWVTAGSAVTLGVAMASDGAPLASQLVGLALEPGFLVPVLCASLFATVLALSLMNAFQRELDPVRAAILYAIEPVWASLVALWIGLGEVDAWLWVGGSALLAGNLIAEVGPSLAARARARGA